MPTTVEQYVTERAGAGLGQVFAAVAAAACAIAKKIRLAGLGDVYGAYGAVNVQGEQQQKLDVFANEELIAQLGKVGSVAAIVSEEDEGPVTFEHAGAEFVVIFDPLDGSSNIDVNVNVGTIFSVVRVQGEVVASVLQPGTAQVAAGYVVYGPSCVFVLTLGDGVAAFGFGNVRQVESCDHYGKHNESERDDEVRQFDRRSLLQSIRVQHLRRHGAKFLDALRSGG